MENIEIVVVNNHIYLAEVLNESNKDAVLTYIIDEDNEPMCCSIMDDSTRNMVFNDGAVTSKMLKDIEARYPEYNVHLETKEVNTETDILVYDYNKLLNGFLIKVLHSIESNDQYI